MAYLGNSPTPKRFSDLRKSSRHLVDTLVKADARVGQGLARRGSKIVMIHEAACASMILSSCLDLNPKLPKTTAS